LKIRIGRPAAVVAFVALLAHAVAAWSAPPNIPLATGSGVATTPQPHGPFFDITAFGAVSGGPALANQAAINSAIDAAAAAGGGTVVVPAGDFKTYSVRLKSNVGINLATKASSSKTRTPPTRPDAARRCG